MSKTQSSMLPLGTLAPHFMLQDAVSEQWFSLHQPFDFKATVIMFLCNHCPYVKHVNKGLVQLAKDYAHQAISFIAISSNNIEEYPADAPEYMKITAQNEGYSFPYLFDQTQSVAKAYHATCTPDFFVFNQNLLLAYRGQLDDSRPGNTIPVSGQSIRQALDTLLNDENIDMVQKPSLGCNIKWK